MLTFSGKTTQGERINFGFNDIRNIVKDNDIVILDKPRDVRVKFSTIEVEEYDKEIRGSSFPMVARLGYY
jgi:hypothetical protein